MVVVVRHRERVRERERARERGYEESSDYSG